MKKNTRPTFLHRAFSALATLVLLPAIAQAVNISVSNVYVDRNGTAAGTDAVFRTGDTIKFYVETDQPLDGDTLAGKNIEFKFRLKNSTATEFVRYAEYTKVDAIPDNEEVIAIHFEYTVQSDDASATNALYAVTGTPLFSGNFSGISTLEGDNVGNMSTVTWSGATNPLKDYAGSSRVYVNPPVNFDGKVTTTSIYIDPGQDIDPVTGVGRYRTDDTVAIYVQTEPKLDPATIPSGLKLNFRLRSPNFTSTAYNRTADYVDMDGDNLIFEYTVQARDATPSNALYATTGKLFTGTTASIRAVGFPNKLVSFTNWTSEQAATPLSDPVSFNPEPTLVITGYEFDRTGTFVTDQTIGIFVKTEPMLDEETLDLDNFTFNFRFSEKDGIRKAKCYGIYDAPSGEEALYFTYTIQESDFSAGDFFPADEAPLFGNRDYPFGDVRTIEGDKVKDLLRFNVADPEEAIDDSIIVNPNNATYVAVNFLDSDGNPFNSNDYYDILEGDRVSYRVDIARVPADPVTVTIEWGVAGVFDVGDRTEIVLDGVSSVTRTIDIPDDGPAPDGDHRYTITASRDGAAPATMKARVKNVVPEFLNLGGPDMVFGAICGTNYYYAVGAPVTSTIQFTDIAGTNDVPFTVSWTLGASSVTNTTLERLGNSWYATSTVELGVGENRLTVIVRDKNGGSITTNATYVTREGGMIYADPAEPNYLGLGNLGDGTISILQPGNNTVTWIPENGTPLPQTDNPIANLRANPFRDSESDDGFDSFAYRWHCERDRDTEPSDTTATLREGATPITAFAKVNLLEDSNVKPEERVWSNPTVKYLFSRELYRFDNFGDIDGDGLSDVWEGRYLQETAGTFTKPGSDDVLVAAESASANRQEGYDFSGTGNFDADGLPADCFDTIKYFVENDIDLAANDRIHSGRTSSIIPMGAYDVRAFRYPLDATTIFRYGYFPLGGGDSDDATRNEAELFRNSPYVDENAKSSIDRYWVNFSNIIEFRGIGEYENFYDGAEEITFRPYGDGDEPGTRPDKPDTDDDGRPDGWEYYFWAVAYYNINPDQWLRFDGIPNGETFKGSGTPIDRDEILSAFSPTRAGGQLTDTDGDGLTDFEEYTYGTNPIHWDTDGDGIADGWEIDNELNPLDPGMKPNNPTNPDANPDGDWMAFYKDSDTGVEYRHFGVYEKFDFDPRTAWRDPKVETVSYAGNTFSAVEYVNTVTFSNREEFDLGAWYVARGIVDYISPDPNDKDHYWGKFCTSPQSADSDEDGIPDGWEAYVGIPDFADDWHTFHNPLDAKDASVDAENFQGHRDGDGLNNFHEFLCTGAIAQYDHLASYSGEADEWANKPWPTNPNISIGIGYADGCDTDGDQILDGFEKTPGANPTCVDTDHDWLPDGWECTFGTDPVIRDTFMDYDGDGLQNWQEYLTGAVWAWQYDKWYDLARRPTNLGEGMFAWSSSGISIGQPFGFGPQGPGYGSVDMFDFFVSAGDRDTFGSTFGGYGRHPHPWDVSFDAMARINKMPNNATSTPFYFLLAENRGGVFEVRLIPAKAMTGHGISDLGEPRDTTGFNATVTNGLAGAAAADGTDERWSYSLGDLDMMPFLLFATADPWNADSDDDGMSDFYEAFHGLNPLYAKMQSRGQDLVYKSDPLNPLLAYPSAPWDLLSYPWLVGDPDADPDKDGLSSREESANFAVEGGNHHTDPSPLWITDTSYERSFVNLYYQPGRVMADPLAPLWYFGYGGENSSGSSAPLYAFSFEANEGYDTDNDNVADRSEVTIDELQAKSDPLDFDNPRRRKALYLNGVDAAARTRGGYVVGNLDKVDFNTLDPGSDVFDAVMDSLDDLRTFTVEAWICPEEPVSGRYQTIIERGATVSQDTAKDDTTGKRLNFRLSITPTGALRGEFHNYQGAHVTLETDVTSTGLRAGVWTHVAMTYSGRPSQGGVLAIYVNGTSRGSTPSNLQAFNGILPNVLDMYSSGGYEYSVNYVRCPIVVGASDAAPNNEVNGHIEYSNGGFPVGVPDEGPALQDFFKGWIDEVRIWDGAASPEAIRSRMYDRFDSGAVAANHYAPMDGVAGHKVTIRYHYSFDNLPDVLPAADRNPAVKISPSDVESLPVGLDELYTAPVDGSYPGVPWWTSAPVHGYRYDARHIPWIENTVAHMASGTVKDDIRIKAERDTDIGAITGWRVDKYEATFSNGRIAAVNELQGLAFDAANLPNAADPYGVVYTTVAYDANYSGTASTPGDYQRSEGAVSDSYSADTLDWSSDLLPLGGAVADFDIELWDGNGLGYEVASIDSDADGIPDWWETLHGLDPSDPSDAWEDFDRDGLDNLAEFLAGTSPIATDSDGDGYTDYYDRDTDKSLTYGELYDDGDLMPAWWEYLYDLDPRRDDGAEDADGDGWSNYAEYLAGSDPRQTTHHPVPPVVFNVWNASGSTDGGALSGDLYVYAYADPEMQGRPDAVYLQNIHPKDNGFLTINDEWIGVVREGVYTYSGQLALANVDNSGSLQIQFYTDQHYYFMNYTLTAAPRVSSNFNVASTYECKECGATYSANEMQRSGTSVVGCPQGHQRYVANEDGTTTENLIAYLPAGSTLSASGGMKTSATIDYLSGKWTITIPSDELPTLVGASMIASYSAEANPVFPFQMRRKFTSMVSGSHAHNGMYGTDSTGQWLVSAGYLREGENRFFAFLDQNENGLYDQGEPAGMAVYQPVEVGPGAVEVTIPLTDSLTGYPRFHWAPAPAGKDGQAYGAEYFVTLRVGDTMLLNKQPVSSRPFFMENDVADTHGIILGQLSYLDWTWEVYTNANDETEYVSGEGRFDIGDNNTRRAFTILSPTEGTVVSDPSLLAKWTMDWRNEGVVVTLKNTDNNKTYISNQVVNHPQRFGATYDNDYYFAIEPQKVLGGGTFIDLPDGNYTLTLSEYIQSSHVTKGKATVNFIIDHSGATNPNPQVNPLGSISGTVMYYGKIPFTVTDEIVGTFDGTSTRLSGALTHTPIPGAVTVRVINGATTNVVATDAGALDGYTSWGLVSGSASVLDGSVTYGDSPAVSLQLDHAPSAGSKLVVTYKQYDCPILIQAFATSDFIDGNTTASFSGTPVAQISVYNKGAFTLEGLPWGTYYLRAFIDQDQDRVLDSWESVGYAMNIVRTDYGMDNFQAVAPGDRNVEIVIKDRDTDSDMLPDAWEYYYFGGLEAQGGYSQKKAGVLLWQEYADGELDSNPLVEDTDGDGLPDVIEHQIGSYNHAWDTDGDGIGDLEEFLAGSVPTDASSKARFAAPAPSFDEDGTPAIVLQTPYLAPGTYLKYELLVKGSLADRDWESLGFSKEVGVDKTNPVGQPAGTVKISDPDGKGVEASFYKVKAHFGSDTLLDE